MPTPIVFLISLTSAWIVSVVFGWQCIRIGMRGVRGEPFPLTKKHNVTGGAAFVGGLLMAGFGIFVCVAGAIAIPLCIWGVWSHARR